MKNKKYRDDPSPLDPENGIPASRDYSKAYIHHLLKAGEILVTRFTEPSWTPIFVNAAGVVMEVGGPMQHGAIIAREYAIPCVSGIDNVHKIIKDGDVLEMDGADGTVRIVESASGENFSANTKRSRQD